MKKENIHNIETSGFKTPEHYFESFDEQLLERLDEKELLSVTKTSGFTVPNSYFDSIEENIMSQLNTEVKPVIRLKSRTALYYIAGIAASIVLLFGLLPNTDDQINISSIETASIENYLFQEDYINDELATLFNPDDISETDFIDIDISDDTINEYLENVDTEDFILN